LCPFTSAGLAMALIGSLAEEERMDVLGMQDFDFAQSDSILPNKTCWRM